MVGRIPVLDVTPQLEGGQYPAKAAVGEPFEVTATRHPRRPRRARRGGRAHRSGGRPSAPLLMHRDPAEADRWTAPPWSADTEGPWASRSTAGATRTRPGGTTPRSRCRPGIDTELMFTEGALLLERAAERRRRARTARRSSTPRRRCATTRPPRRRTPRRRQLARGDRRCWPRTRCASCSRVAGPFPFFVDRDRALYGSWYEFFPRSEGAYVDADGQGGQRHLPDRREAARRPSPRWASTSSTCRRSTRSARSTARAEQHPRPRPRRRRLAVGDRVRGGRPRRRAPRPRHDRRLRRVRRPRARARSRGRARPRAAGGPGPPVGDRAPGVLHDACRRHDRLRGEPAEEVPGHLPAQLRQRPRGHLRRGAPRRPALDGPRGARLPGRQPAHQAGRVLGVAARRGPQDRPRRALPRPRRSPGRR